MNGKKNVTLSLREDVYDAFQIARIRKKDTSTKSEIIERLIAGYAESG